METLVVINRTPKSATIKDDGFTDIFYSRTITNAETGEILVRDIVCETAETRKVVAEITKLQNSEKANADSPA